MFLPIILFLVLPPITVGGLGVREAGFIYFFGTTGMEAEATFALSLLIYLGAIVSALPGAWVGVSALARNKVE